MVKFPILVAATFALSASATFPFSLSNKISPDRVVSDIKKSDLMRTLKDLDNIANANGGNRAFGTPGYTASVDYILAQVNKCRSRVNVRQQEFTYLYTHIDEVALNVVGQDPLQVVGFLYSPSTPPGGITAELVLGPLGEAACLEESYAGLDVQDKIVVTDRFVCSDGTSFASRVRIARAVGAKAMLIWFNFDELPEGVTLAAPDPDHFVPAALLSKSDGEAFKAQLEAGEIIQVNFKHLQTIEQRKTWNVIAETKTGDPNAMIMVGAHLDSVPAGPGINDNGSGSSLVLELLRSVQKYDTNLKVQFAWWGAEEVGLIGSDYYVSNNGELDKLRAYLNFDMVSKGFYGVQDGDGSDVEGMPAPPGSDIIEKFFIGYLEKQGLTTVPIAFDPDTDHTAFLEKGIAVGGLFTGAGPDEDACYHQACDTYNNVNATILTHNAKAAGYTLANLALDGKSLLPRRIENRGYVSARKIARQVDDSHGHGHGRKCGKPEQ